jgi:hypothetical protein
VSSKPRPACTGSTLGSKGNRRWTESYTKKSDATAAEAKHSNALHNGTQQLMEAGQFGR